MRKAVFAASFAALMMQNVLPATAGVILVGGNTLTGSRNLTPGVSRPAGLQAFSFSFENGDHHIKGITALPSTYRTTVNFQDNDGNDPYKTSLRYEDALGNGARSVLTLDNKSCNGGTCRVRLPVPCGSTNTFVLTGFSFQFKDGDRQIKKVAVKRFGDELEVSFGDKTPSDPYVWSVQYAVVPRASVKGEYSISRTSNGLATVSRQPGRAVIQGFSFEFTSEDHHLRDFKIDLQDERSARINFQDNNLDDSVRWSVNYAILR